MQVRARSRSSNTFKGSALRWLPTFVGFPLGGLAAKLIVGPVDTRATAVVGGAITGAILGAAQSWGLGAAGTSARRWVAGTAVGLAAGLAIGSAAVDYGTSMRDLAVQGAICGLGVGTAQAVVLRPRLGNLAFLWAPLLGALWAFGWAITTALGIDVESQYTVFGAGGAITVTAATAVLPVVLARLDEGMQS